MFGRKIGKRQNKFKKGTVNQNEIKHGKQERPQWKNPTHKIKRKSVNENETKHTYKNKKQNNVWSTT